MADIRTNEIVLKADYDAFDRQYEILEIRKPPYDSREGKYDFAGTSMLDTPLTNKKVMSILHKAYRKGCAPCIYVLMKKSDDNRYTLKNLIKNDPKYETITIKTVKSKELEKCDLLQLCFNSIASKRYEDVNACNLAGGLYLFTPQNIVSRYTNGECEQIATVQLKVSPEMKLYLNVVTFTNIKELYDSAKDIRDLYSQPVYKVEYSPVITMKRVFNTDKNGSLFVKKHPGKNRNEICFMDIRNKKRFNASKIGMLNKSITYFNKMYGKLLCIDFNNVKNYYSLEYKAADKKASESNIKAFLKDKTINIVNLTGSNKYDSKIQDIIQCFEWYGANVELQDKVDSRKLNVVMIHEKDFYGKKQKDQYISSKYKNCIIQHITVEKINGSDFKLTQKKTTMSVGAGIHTIIFNLIIKNDIKNGKFTLYDWSKISRKMQFVMKYGDKDNKKTAIMTVSEDGRFDIKYREKQTSMFDDIDENEDNEPEFSVIAGNDEFVISATKWFTLPDFEGIAKEIEKNDTVSRGKEARDELMASCIDIKTFKIEEGCFAYFVGTPGDGMGVSLNNAATIRIIETEKNNRYEKVKNILMPLMNVLFVRNNRLTVIPFPFKYIREWAELDE